MVRRDGAPTIASQLRRGQLLEHGNLVYLSSMRRSRWKASITIPVKKCPLCPYLGIDIFMFLLQSTENAGWPLTAEFGCIIFVWNNMLFISCDWTFQVFKYSWIEQSGDAQSPFHITVTSYDLKFWLRKPFWNLEKLFHIPVTLFHMSYSAVNIVQKISWKTRAYQQWPKTLFSEKDSAVLQQIMRENILHTSPLLIQCQWNKRGQLSALWHPEVVHHEKRIND